MTADSVIRRPADPKMSELKNGWYTQQERTRPGYVCSLKIKEILAEKGDAAVFRTDLFGLMLTDSGVLRFAARDTALREMTVHCALFAHEEPRRALIVNGGDGALAGEFLRHRALERIDVQERSDDVLKLAAGYLPETGKIFKDSRVELSEESLDDLLESRDETWDVICADCPGSVIRIPSFLRTLKSALAPDGILMIRCAPWILAPKKAEAVVREMNSLFANASFGLCPSPVRAGGHVVLCTGSDVYDGARPVRRPLRGLAGRLKFYSSAYHKAIFQQPAFPGIDRLLYEDADDRDE